MPPTSDPRALRLLLLLLLLLRFLSTLPEGHETRARRRAARRTRELRADLREVVRPAMRLSRGRWALQGPGEGGGDLELEPIEWLGWSESESAYGEDDEDDKGEEGREGTASITPVPGAFAF